MVLGEEGSVLFRAYFRGVLGNYKQDTCCLPHKRSRHQDTSLIRMLFVAQWCLDFLTEKVEIATNTHTHTPDGSERRRERAE